jgi:hypothetical protein
MLFRYIVLIGVLSLMPGVIIGADSVTSHSNLPDSEGLAAALQRAAAVQGSPFHLQVNCTDQKGIRSLELYSSGTAIWNRRSQLKLPAAARTDLLNTLINQGFAQFEDSYGGRERPAKAAAATRISCRILIEIEDLQKSSVHKAGGEQSTMLTSLAGDLLDQGERYAHNGVTPGDLHNAIDMLSNGQLAPETLRLRFVDLPRRDNTNPGSILLLSGGEMSHQAYSPGKAIAGQKAKPIEPGQFHRLTSALQAAQITSLPGNLWSDDQLEFEIEILTHKKVVLARQFTRLDPKAPKPAQQRFDTLLSILRELGR